MRELLRTHTRNDAVEALAVEVDDPGQLAETTGGRVGQRLPDVPLVELGVAHQRHEAATGLSVEMRIHVTIDNTRKQRGCRTQTNRAGREVDRVRILRA